MQFNCERQHNHYIPEHIEYAAEVYREKLTKEEQAFYMCMRDADIEQYKEIFDIFDETGDGTISNDEIGKVMQGLGEASTPEKINELIA